MHYKLSSAICFNLDQSKILSSGNRLKETYQLKTLHNDADGEVAKDADSNTTMTVYLIFLERSRAKNSVIIKTCVAYSCKIVSKFL